MPRNDDSIAHDLERVIRRKLPPKPSINDLLTAYSSPPDPVGFAREVLKLWPTSAQEKILNAVATHKRVSTVSGHKIGKSTALAILALWFYCSYDNARVVITATTDNQVNGIIWREIKRLAKRAKRAGFDIPDLNQLKAVKAHTGMTHPVTDTEIRGYTAKEAEAIAGVSGAKILYLVDEASGVKNMIFDAIEGNRAGGEAWVFLISNPTKADGEFYDSHHSKSQDAIGATGYLAIHVDSRESPNITGEWREIPMWDWGDQRAGRPAGWIQRTEIIPGIAWKGWVDEKLIEWGEDSALFKIRVAGLFCVAEEAKVFQHAMLAAAEVAWHDAVPTGRLLIGCDPAGDGDGGDESGFCARRGLKVTQLRARAGMSPEAHIAEIQDIIAAEQLPTELKRGPRRPVVIIESEGEAGWKVFVKLREHAERTAEFDVVRVRTSQRATRQPLIYKTTRDEVWASAREWMREGGAIPESVKLARDLHAPEFKSGAKGLLQVTPKKDLRKLLGRSPDIGDAFVLCCWEPLSIRDTGKDKPAAPPRETGTVHDEIDEPSHDPYGGGDWSRGWRVAA